MSWQITGMYEIIEANNESQDIMELNQKQEPEVVKILKTQENQENVKMMDYVLAARETVHEVRSTTISQTKNNADKNEDYTAS